MKPVRPSSQELSPSASSSAPAESALAGGAVNRRHFLAGAAGVALLAAVDRSPALASVVGEDVSVNLAKVATPSAANASGDAKLSALNDGFDPTSSHDHQHPVFGTWPHVEPQWV
jgi:hypothetical protein